MVDFPLWVGVIAMAVLTYLFGVFKNVSMVEAQKHVEVPTIEDEVERWNKL